MKKLTLNLTLLLSISLVAACGSDSIATGPRETKTSESTAISKNQLALTKSNNADTSPTSLTKFKDTTNPNKDNKTNDLTPSQPRSYRIEPGAHNHIPKDSGRKPFGQGNVNWQLIVSDNFNKFDTNLWENGFYPSSSGWSKPVHDKEQACYHTGEVKTQNGKLVLSLRQLTQSEKNAGVCKKKHGQPSNYVAGYVNSRKGIKITPGTYTEAYISFAGEGSSIYNWQQFWVADLSQNKWPKTGEIDIAEVLSGKPCANFHYANPRTGAHDQADSRCTAITANQGHYIGMKWNHDGVVQVFIDGKQISDHRNNNSPNYQIDTVALAGPQAKNFVQHFLIGFSMPESNKPAFKAPGPGERLDMLVDYVDVYKLN